MHNLQHCNLIYIYSDFIEQFSTGTKSKNNLDQHKVVKF